MEPLKVLIVDDEYLIRNLLRMRIDWERQGMAIVGEASDAQEALELTERLRPDIVFTDIYMPKMDGIELSRIVLDHYPHMKIVVVTGHDEFEYARQSIKLGISDFILKPIRASELLNVTDKLRESIQEERLREHELVKLREEMERNLPYLRERFVNQWLHDVMTEGKIKEQFRLFGIPVPLREDGLRVAILEVIAPAAQRTEERLILLRMECMKQIETFYRHHPHVITVTDTYNRMVVLSLSPAANFVEEVERLQEGLIRLAGIEVTVGIGRQQVRWADACQSYREACRALHYQAFAGKNQVICFEDLILEVGERPYRSDAELLQQLQFYVSVGAEEQAILLLEQMLSAPFSDISQFRMAAMDIITECQRAAIEQQIEDERAFDTEALAAMLAARYLPELKIMLEQHVRGVTRIIQAKRQAKEGNLIDQVKVYLEENMGNSEVGLASTAMAFFVSPGHLGRLMKKETGQTFVEYLTQSRMKRAEMLLKQTDLKGYEIGERVGISDPHYFSVLFKKNTGRSMNEYRNVKS